jgi:hypothetical protein
MINGKNSTAGGTNNLSCYNCYKVWVSGVESYEAQSIHMVCWQCSHWTFQSNYLWGIQGHGGSATQSYGTDTYSGSSDGLIANNIMQHLAVSMQNEGGWGNVYFYNACRDNDNSAAPNFPLGDYIQHAPGTGYNLSEGNQCNRANMDNFHGSNGGAGWTAYRNWWRGAEIGQVWQTSAIDVSMGSRNNNIVANILGLTGFHTGYYLDSAAGAYQPPCTNAQCNAGMNPGAAPLTVLNTGFSGLQNSRIFTSNCNTYCPIDDIYANLPSAGTGFGTTMAWANYDPITANPRFCGNSSDTRWSTANPAGCSSKSEIPTAAGFAASIPSLGDTTIGQGALPVSFYSNSLFNTFGHTPFGDGKFPSVGPDVAGGNAVGYGGHLYYNPAEIVLQNMAVDNSLSTTSAVTNATCSSGSVTLTIGVNAALVDIADIIIVSGITPSGYNTPTSATGTPRTQVTGGNGSTTVTYQVPSCPGAYVSGGNAIAPVVFSFNAANSYSALAPAPVPAPAQTMFMTRNLKPHRKEIPNE